MQSLPIHAYFQNSCAVGVVGTNKYTLLIIADSMRFRIILSDISGAFLPINHNSYISSWIYKRIGEADKGFAEFLHSQGYGEGNKRFKFFNFGMLDFRPYQLHRDRGVFELLGNEIKLEVSFFLPEIAEPFIKGLFMNNEVFIGDRINGINATVREVHILPSPDFRETMYYRLISPCCVSRPPGEGEKHAQYLEPGDEGFVRRLIDNIKTKYDAAAHVLSAAGVHDEGLEVAIDIPRQKVKTKLLTIKAMTEAETRVKGSLFECTVTASPEVQEFIYAVGLGEKGSLGFGMLGR